jgi:hypothetical protein
MKLANITSNKWFPVVILFLLVLLFFSPVFLHGRVIFPDLLNYYEPWNDYAQDLPFRYSHLKSDFVDALIPKINLIKTELEQGNVSLWSDTIDLGKPLIQTSLEFLLMPIYIFVWILPTDIGFTIAIILKTLIGAFGMYFWLVDLKVRKGVAIIVGVVYAFSGFNSSWFLGNAAIVGQFAPWAFLCVNRIYDSKSVGRLWGNSFALILVYFFLIVSGFVAGAGYIIYFSAFYVLILFMVDAISWCKTKDGNFFSRMRPGVLVLLAIIFAVGLGSIKLLPNLEWINFIDIGYREAYSASRLSYKNLAQLIFPNYFGNPIFFNTFGPGNWNETSSYVTIVLLLMAPIGIVEALKERNKHILTIGFLALLSFFIIWGIGPLLDIVRKLPVFNSSSSTRLIMVLDLFLCALGAYGIESLFKFRNIWLGYLLLGVGLVVVLASIVRTVVNIQGVELNSLNLFEPLIFRLLSSLPAVMFIAGFGLFIFLWNKKVLSEKAFIIMIAIILLVDIYHFSYRQIPMVPRDHFFPETKMTTFLEEHQADGRTVVFDGMFMISGSQLYYGINSVLTHNLHRAREKEIVAQFSEKAWATQTAPMLSAEKTNFDSPVFEFYGVKYVVVTQATEIDSETWTLVFNEPSEGKVYENLEYSDKKYWFSSNVNVIKSESDFFDRLDEITDFETIFVEYQHIQADVEQVEEISLVVKTDTNDMNILEVCTDSPGILTTRESYWPGWTATVNGMDQPVYEVNYIYRGVPVEAGCSEVIEQYAPEAFRLGRTISIITLIILILTGIGVLIWKHKKITIGHVNNL